MNDSDLYYSFYSSPIGKPNEVRAVGSACVDNPIPLIIPCHRVIKSDGSLGNYGGGIKMKNIYSH